MLPAEAELLASSRHCNVEVWSLGSNVLCIQGAEPCSLAKLALCPSLPACVPLRCPAQFSTSMVLFYMYWLAAWVPACMHMPACCRARTMAFRVSQLLLLSPLPPAARPAVA